MGFLNRKKPWQFGRRARLLPLAEDASAWVETHAGDQGVGVRTHESPLAVRRYPSQSPPETLEGVLADPNAFVVKKRRAGDILKYARLYTGETYALPATFEVALRDCWLHVPSGMVISKDKEVLAFSTFGVDAFFEGHSEIEWSEAPWVEEPAFKLATAWGRNYAHWLMDALPQADVLSTDDPRLPILDKNAPEFQAESLNLLGINRNRIPSENLLRFRELHFVTRTKSGVPDPRPLHRVRERLQKSAGVENSKGTRRLYISRQKNRRRIVNGAEAEKVLKDFGFVEMFTEEMGFVDQVRAFSEAEAIFGAHGAGTMNVLFAPAGAALIEAINPRVWDHAAHRVASLGGVRHYHLFAENVSEAFDVRVDLRTLERTLALALDDPAQPRECLIESRF